MVISAYIVSPVDWYKLDTTAYISGQCIALSIWEIDRELGHVTHSFTYEILSLIL